MSRWKVFALSVRQPWAWAIVEGLKDIENRSWSTKFRGPVLLHAAGACTREEYLGAATIIEELMGRTIPKRENLHFGGIVGRAKLVDCVRSSSSEWFGGPWGFVLEERRVLPFLKCKGETGFFRVPDAIVEQLLEQVAVQADG